jgi:hypothetical protein
VTTRIMVTNFGPGEVEVERPNTAPNDRIYPGNYKEYHVCDEQTVRVKEKKAVAPEK